MVGSALPTGAVIAGRYRIAEPIGRGGMGIVYEAWDRGALRAVKVMDPSLVEDPDWRARFEREARIGKSLQGPHVTEVLDYGVDPDTGVPYLVMERLRGKDLEAHIEQRGRLPVLEARRLLKDLCEAVGTAHQAGVVHRDLKPNNVFLTDSGDVKVLDFGIAKVLTEWRSTVSRAMGTPGWMAPEQLDSAGKIGPPTDVWAIGLLAFYVLTGRGYWLSFDKGGGSWQALCKEICIDPLEPASARAARYGFTDLPRDFDPWFARCVHRDASARHADARAALRELDSVLKVKLLKTPVPPEVAGTGLPTFVTMPADPAISALSPTHDPDEEEDRALAAAGAELSRRVREALEKERNSTPSLRDIASVPDKPPPEEKKKKTKLPDKVILQAPPDPGAAVKTPHTGDQYRWLVGIIAVVAIILLIVAALSDNASPSSAEPSADPTIPLPNTNSIAPPATLSTEGALPAPRPRFRPFNK